MTATDKFPEEMLDDIREAAVKARVALDSLGFIIDGLSIIYPTFRHARVAMWKSEVANMANKADAIANVAEELADAEEEGGAE